MNPDIQVSRRRMVQGLGVVGVGALAARSLQAGEPEAPVAPAAENGGATGAGLLPTRKLGRNGPMVSMLALGGDMPRTARRRSSTGLGARMRYFDTAQKYGKGEEEGVYRQWFAQHPERRKEVFLVSKDYPKKGPEELLAMVDSAWPRSAPSTSTSTSFTSSAPKSTAPPRWIGPGATCFGKWRKHSSAPASSGWSASLATAVPNTSRRPRTAGSSTRSWCSTRRSMSGAVRSTGR